MGEILIRCGSFNFTLPNSLCAMELGVLFSGNYMGDSTNVDRVLGMLDRSVGWEEGIETWKAICVWCGLFGEKGMGAHMRKGRQW